MLISFALFLSALVTGYVISDLSRRDDQKKLERLRFELDYSRDNNKKYLNERMKLEERITETEEAHKLDRLKLIDQNSFLQNKIDKIVTFFQTEILNNDN